MKSKFVIAAVLAVMSFETAMAAGLTVNVRERMQNDAGKTKDVRALVEVKEKATTKEIESALAEKLTKTATVSKNELEAAMSKKLNNINSKGEAVKISVHDLAVQLLRTQSSIESIRGDQAKRTIELSKAQEAELASQEKGLKAAIEALSLFSKVSEVNPTTTAATKSHVAVLERQMSLVQDMFPSLDAAGKVVPAKMNTKEMLSHADIMERAVAAKTNPDVRGDVAMHLAFEAKYGKDKAEAKEKELEGCVR